MRIITPACYESKAAQDPGLAWPPEARRRRLPTNTTHRRARNLVDVKGFPGSTCPRSEQKRPKQPKPRYLRAKAVSQQLEILPSQHGATCVDLLACAPPRPPLVYPRAKHMEPSPRLAVSHGEAMFDRNRRRGLISGCGIADRTRRAQKVRPGRPFAKVPWKKRCVQ